MRGRRPLLHAISTVIALVTLAGCGQSIPHSTDATPTHEQSGLEFECEQELLHLDGLIALQSDDAAFPEHRLIEARALRDVAADLCMEGQADLALELIAEAALLLGNS